MSIWEGLKQMNRFMVGCGASEMYNVGDILGQNLVSDATNELICKWDASLLGKHIFAVSDNAKMSCNFICNGDTGQVVWNEHGAQEDTRYGYRFFRSGDGYYVYAGISAYNHQLGIDYNLPVTYLKIYIGS
jgi:hypothetical protein